MGGSEEKLREEGWNGLPSVSGSGHPVGGRIKTEDDGHRIILPGETESESTVFRVQVGDAVGVSGSPPKDSAREGNMREKALG